MKKILAVIFIVCITLTLVYVTALANSDVRIVPYTWDPDTEVYSDQNIILGAGWLSCRYGAVQNFLTATSISWTVYDEGGNLVDSGKDTNRYWSRPEKVHSPSADCMGKPVEFRWHSVWNYPSIGPLPAGDYTLYFNWRLDHPVNEVGDYDGDGRPDRYKPGQTEDVIAIHVVDR